MQQRVSLYGLISTSLSTQSPSRFQPPPLARFTDPNFLTISADSDEESAFVSEATAALDAREATRVPLASQGCDNHLVNHKLLAAATSA